LNGLKEQCPLGGGPKPGGLGRENPKRYDCSAKERELPVKIREVHENRLKKKGKKNCIKEKMHDTEKKKHRFRRNK